MKPACFIPRRTGAINPAVERREANVPRHGTSGASQRLRAYVTRPPTGAAAPERLSALRFPHLVMRENWQTSEGLMPRENDETCPRASPEDGAARKRSGSACFGET